jgi:hypothetical protein
MRVLENLSSFAGVSFPYLFILPYFSLFARRSSTSNKEGSAGMQLKLPFLLFVYFLITTFYRTLVTF